MQCTVLTVSKAYGIGSGLTYETDRTDVRSGSAVTVPLRNRIVEGIVLDVTQQHAKLNYDIKSIHEVFGSEPLLTEAQLRTAEWISQYYRCSKAAALRLFLPTPPWKKLLPGSVRSFSVENAENPRGEKQRAVISFVRENTSATEQEIKAATSATTATLSALVRGGYLSETVVPEFLSDSSPLPPYALKLTPLQQTARDVITSSHKPCLLFGITGSGKTELYADRIRSVIAEGKSAIVLVPEIFLTAQTVQKLQSSVAPDAISVLHSKLTPAERRYEWRRIRFGSVRLVIGSRSALFAPVRNPGLVIIDEEHEWTYKNEQTPRYHARETAEAFCRETGAKLLLGTATPSLEAWQRVKSGAYDMASLPERYAGATLPKVSVVDLAHVNFGSSYPLSKTLILAMEERLAKHEQCVLFLNRRGLASALMCMGCRRKVTSPDSGLPFTVHPGSGDALTLRDHTSGRTMDAPSVCPDCGSTSLRSIGAGTQRIEAILKQTFPRARVVRADSDVLLKTEDMKSVLSAMQRAEADILIGTQTVVKGLDLPNVTLAAVLIADIGLSLPHFRAGERTFQLVTQLIGRSGRSKPGEVIIQTFRPDAPELRHAVFHQTEAYLAEELSLREAAGYPPARSMARIIFRGPSAAHDCTIVCERLKSFAEPSDIISFAPTLLGAGKEWHILIRSADVHALLERVPTAPGIVDIDPLECI